MGVPLEIEFIFVGVGGVGARGRGTKRVGLEECRKGLERCQESSKTLLGL